MNEMRSRCEPHTALRATEVARGDSFFPTHAAGFCNYGAAGFDVIYRRQREHGLRLLLEFVHQKGEKGSTLRQSPVDPIMQRRSVQQLLKLQQP